MSIKAKALPPPPMDCLPPYAKDTKCWGCDRLFDMLELRETGLCSKCHLVVHRIDKGDVDLRNHPSQWRVLKKLIEEGPQPHHLWGASRHLQDCLIRWGYAVEHEGRVSATDEGRQTRGRWVAEMIERGEDYLP